MLFKDIDIVNENMEIDSHVDVLIKDDRIDKILPTGEEMDAYLEASGIDRGEVYQGKNLLLMPAFYNAHGHSTMTLMRGYGENMTLQDWLFTKIFPFEDHLTHEAVYYGTMISMAESFKYGIASTSDMYYFLDDIVSAVRDAGGKSNISRAIANPAGIPFDQLESIREMKDAVNKYNGIDNGRIIIDGSLHAEYTSNEDTAINLAKLTKELNLIMHVHLSETETEHVECMERHEGRTPAKYFDDCGLFDMPSLAAHCVWVTEDDIDILAKKGVVVATNAVSNLKLASGICPVKDLIDGGVTVAIGTDSVASNNNLNIFEEMKTMMLLAKVKEMDPRVLSPRQVLHMATRNGALAQGRWDCGYIKEGFKADIVVLKTDSPNMHPVYDMISNIVLSATDSDIRMTIVDGRIVYKDGILLTIDMEDTINGVNRSIKDILGRL